MARGRDTLVQRIAMDGGEAIKKQLNELGDAGVKAFKDIQEAAAQAGQAGPQFRKSYEEIRDAIAALQKDIQGLTKSAKQFDQAWKRMETSFKNTVRQATILSAAVTGAAAGFYALTLSAARQSETQTGDTYNLIRAYDEAAKTVNKLKQELLLLFAPGLTQVTEAFTKLIRDNRDALLQVGETVRKAVVPVFQDVIKILSGREVEVDNKWLIEIKDSIVALSQAFVFLYGVAQTVFRGIESALQPLVDAFNAVFGTQLTARQIIVTALLGQFLGVFRLIGTVVNVAVRAISLFGTAIGFVARNIKDIILLATTFTRTVGTSVTSTLSVITTFAAAAFAAITTAWDQLVVVFNQAVEFVRSLFAGSQESIAAPILTAITAVQEAFTNLGTFISEALNSVVQIAADVAQQFVDVWNAAIGAVEGVFTSLGDFVNGVIDSVIEAITRVLNAAKAAAEMVKKALGFSGGGAAPGFAGGGGPIRGVGTGTSDSIPAWLSHGEFVIRASAVRKYGLGFLHAVNKMKLPGGAARGFSMGGLADDLMRGFQMPQPRYAFAEGGPVQGGRPLTLNIDGQSFGGLTAPEDVAERLVRFARGRNMLSAGKKPSWYGEG